MRRRDANDGGQIARHGAGRHSVALGVAAVVAVFLAALFGASPAQARTATDHPVRGARSLAAARGTALAEQRRARQRRRGIAHHHAVIRHPGHRAKHRHGAALQPAGPPAPAGSPPITMPSTPLPPSDAPQAPASQSEGRTGTGAADLPPIQHGTRPDPELESPPAGEPEPPAGEPGGPPGEGPGTPPAEEPEPPSSEEPEPPAGEEPPSSEEPGPPAGEEPGPPSGEEPEPPGGEEPSTPPPGPGLLFEGSRIRDFAAVQAAPGAVTEVADPLGSGERVFQLTVDDDDVAPVTPTENPRAQLVSPDLIEAGDEFWLETKFLIPQDFPTVTGWMSVLSIYGPPFNASSPWQIEVIGDHLQWMRNRTYDFDVPWQAPLIKGSWVTVLTHERFAADGFIEMWINGQPVSFFGRESRLEMKTMDGSNGSGANSIRMSQYRQAGMFETGTVYFGPVRFGATRAAVEG